MIIEIVQDDFLDMRINLTNEGRSMALPEGYKIEFAGSVLTDSGKTMIHGISRNTDMDGRVVISINLKELNVSPGRYRFELNLITDEDRKVCIIPERDNELIVLKKAGEA